jgi:hypothetical protein
MPVSVNKLKKTVSPSMGLISPSTRPAEPFQHAMAARRICARAAGSMRAPSLEPPAPARSTTSMAPRMHRRQRGYARRIHRRCVPTRAPSTKGPVLVGSPRIRAPAATASPTCHHTAVGAACAVCDHPPSRRAALHRRACSPPPLGPLQSGMQPLHHWALHRWARSTLSSGPLPPLVQPCPDIER